MGIGRLGAEEDWFRLHLGRRLYTSYFHSKRLQTDESPSIICCAFVFAALTRKKIFVNSFDIPINGLADKSSLSGFPPRCKAYCPTGSSSSSSIGGENICNVISRQEAAFLPLTSKKKKKTKSDRKDAWENYCSNRLLMYYCIWPNISYYFYSILSISYCFFHSLHCAAESACRMKARPQTHPIYLYLFVLTQENADNNKYIKSSVNENFIPFPEQNQVNFNCIPFWWNTIELAGPNP